MQYIISLLILLCTSCAPAVIVGSGAAVGGLSMRSKGISGTLDDTSLSAKIRSHFKEREQQWGTRFGQNITIAVQNHEVLLTGYVNTPEEKQWAERIIWEVFGVKQVNNFLEVKNKQPFGSKCSDFFLKRKISGAVFSKLGFRRTNYSFKVVKGVVYIMGISRSKREQHAVIEAIRRIQGVKKVVCLTRFREEVF